jgi:hypothetical protein
MIFGSEKEVASNYVKSELHYLCQILFYYENNWKGTTLDMLGGNIKMDVGTKTVDYCSDWCIHLTLVAVQ